MAKYRPFLCSFWTDPDIEPMTPEEKLVYAFLFTNNLTSESGIYSISLKFISERTNISINKINNIINTLQNTYHKITYDKTIIFVHGFMNRNYKGNPDLLEKSIIQDFYNNKSIRCWSKFLEIYKIHRISIKIKELLNTCGVLHNTSIELELDMSMKDEDENEDRNRDVNSLNSSLKSPEKLSLKIPDHLVEIWPDFLAMRRAIRKPATERAQRNLFRDLEKFYPGDTNLQIISVEQSITNAWQGVFKIREDFRGKEKQPYDREARRKEMESWNYGEKTV